MSTVSVVICAHAISRLPLLGDAIASVRAQTYAAHEIIVVVDHNGALLARVLSKNPDIRVLENSNEPGLSGARTCGAAAATGDIIAFIDDDAFARSDWLSKLVAHYQDRHVLAVGGRIEPVWPQGRPMWWPEEFDWVVGCSYRGQPISATPVRNLIGCNMSFRRVVFDICGGFSSDLGRMGVDASGCEETEFCIRAQSAFPLSHILYDPAVEVRHQLDPERVNWRYFARRCRAEGRSKALLVALAGHGPSLKSEAAYVRRTLPKGVMRGLLGGRGGLLRAGAIIAGLCITSTAYLSARGKQLRASSNHSPPPFAPIKIAQFDLAEPIGALVCTEGKTGKIYGGAFCLVRQNGVPTGVARFPAYGRTVPSRELSDLLRQASLPHQANQVTAIISQTPTARVVVATRDRPDMLIRCLDTLLVQSCPPIEIHVVDSAPASFTTQDLIAQKYASTCIRYRHEPVPGLGLAHNRGVSGARTEILAFTDDDVVVERDWLECICKAFARDERIGCVTGMILPAELETRAQWWIEAHGGFNKGFEPKLFDLDTNRPKSALFPYASGTFGSGANMAFSRVALEAIGGFDPALGAGTPARGGDDLAAFTAVILAGFRLAYEPGAIVWHHHRRTEEGIAGQAYGYGVGLGSYLTKTLVDHPSSALAYAAGFPAALMHILAPGSSKNARLPSDYPSQLRWAERRGILAGFSAYLRSRRSLTGSAGRKPPFRLSRHRA